MGYKRIGLVVAAAAVVVAAVAWAFRGEIYSAVFVRNPGSLTASAAPLALTPEMQSMLRALEPVRGEGIDAAAFDDRPVLVTFFASWCPPCAQEFDELSDYVERQGTGDISIMAVNWRESSEGGANSGRVERMLARVHPAIPVVVGTDEVEAAFDDVASIPAAFLFHDGVEVARLGGAEGPNGMHYLTGRELQRVLDELSP